MGTVRYEPIAQLNCTLQMSRQLSHNHIEQSAVLHVQHE